MSYIYNQLSIINNLYISFLAYRILVICICLIHICDCYQCIKFLYNVFFFRPVAQFWLERRIDIAEVDGSSPFGSTNIYN